MSVSGVAGPNIPRSWTPILNRRDDSAQAASPTSPDQTTNASDQTSAPTTPAFGMLNQMPSDSIMVSLPNGMSVGIAHFGGGSSGFDAQMLASLEDLVGNLSHYTTTKSTGDGTRPNAAGDGSGTTGSNNAVQGMQAIDMMHVDLPNGISVEIRHSSATPEADGGVAAMNEMEKAMEELVDHFSNIGGSADSGSTATSSAASQRALAAYAAQATQKDDAAVTDGPGVSKAS
jgi:hypothetical protein